MGQKEASVIVVL